MYPSTDRPYASSFYEETCKNIDENDKSTWKINGKNITTKELCKMEKIEYNEYTNKALYNYFKQNPLKIDNIIYNFDGFYPYRINTCPRHGGLCAVVSTLQTQIPHNLTATDIKYYLLKFFEYEYNEISGETFNIKENTDQKIQNLLYYIKDVLKGNSFIVNGKAIEVNNSLKLTGDISEIKVNTNKKFSYYTVENGQMLFKKPKDLFYKTLEQYNKDNLNTNVENEQCKLYKFGNKQSKQIKKQKIKNDIYFLKNLKFKS